MKFEHQKIVRVDNFEQNMTYSYELAGLPKWKTMVISVLLCWRRCYGSHLFQSIF